MTRLTNTARLPLTLLVLLTAAACAHHRDVRPGTDGINHVVVRAHDKTSAERSAISQAEDFCDESHRHPAFTEERTTYTGTMDEATRDTIQKASEAAILIGGTGTAIGRDGTRTGSEVLGGAGTVGSVMTNGDDYTSDMKFRCQ